MAGEERVPDEPLVQAGVPVPTPPVEPRPVPVVPGVSAVDADVQHRDVHAADAARLRRGRPVEFKRPAVLDEFNSRIDVLKLAAV